MIDQELIKLAQDKNFAVLSTLMPDGHPAHPSDVGGRRRGIHPDQHPSRPAEVAERPDVNRRVTVTIWDRDRPLPLRRGTWPVTGTIEGQEARDHIDHLSMKYHGHEYSNPITAPRVVLRVSPDKVIWH